jgi:hypothetical protein
MRPRLCVECHGDADWTIESVWPNGGLVVNRDGSSRRHHRVERVFYCDAHAPKE